MVSFSCEGCGDVLTKKKLDPHRGQCRTASFTCLDCMTHFRGTDYRAHTSCITEDQKYQGALYKEKSIIKSKKSVKITEGEKHAPRRAYVEDAPDVDDGKTIAIVDPPPEAPEPPLIIPPQTNVNVFDFLVAEDTPNASKVSLPAPSPPTKMLQHAPSIIGMEIAQKEPIHSQTHDPDYDTNGFSYGTEPVPLTQPRARQRPPIEFFTPSAKDLEREQARIHKSSTDKKRKRLHVEELDLTAARRPSHSSEDANMSDAPPPVLHSGLTGGLNRLLSKSNFPPSPDSSDGDPEPPSPVHRSSNPSSKSQAMVVKDRGRTSKATSSTLVKVRKRRTSDESRPRKHRRSHRSHDDDDHEAEERGKEEHPPRASHHTHRHHSTDRTKRKAIEYHHHHHPAADGATTSQQLVPYKTRAELFMSFVTKGPESEAGMSVHKVLKRYHRGRADVRGERGEEEKELWRGLRLRRNERGEVVVLF